MNINTNIIDFVWNFKNFKLKDFGLDPEYNMLCAPVCGCRCGEKMNVLLADDDDIYDFCYELVDTQDCNYCVVFAINEKNEMLGAKVKKIEQYDLDENFIKTWSSTKEISNTLDISLK